MPDDYQKMYVSVNLDIDTDGNIRPRAVRLTDGRIYRISRIVRVCSAASENIEGGGIRYTVIIGKSEHFLFFDKTKWFVEVKA